MTSAPGEQETGTRVGGKYRLVRRLAIGGMGEVWVAHNEATGAEVAAKLCRASGADDAVARFRQEARLGARLVHRNIVRIFDLVEDADRGLLLVMELLHGETLESALRSRGPFSAREAVEIMAPILAALAHAHDLGVIHRDVTPANIFLHADPDGHVTPKLLDFGLAKVDASDLRTLEGRVLGTARYMAPERIRGEKNVDGRCDLFSVGAVLYEMLTGVAPFAAESPSASLAAVLENVVDADPRIPPRVWLEVQRALAKRPYERRPNARAMSESLRAAADEGGPGEPPRQAPLRSADVTSGAVPVAGVPLRPYGRWIAAGVLGATLVAIVVYAATLRGRSLPPQSSASATSPASAATPAQPELFARPSATPDAPSAAPSVGPSAPAQDAPLAPSRSAPVMRPPSSAGAPAHSAPVPRKPPKSVATTPGF
jgi:eukaryotic-like serine/threonine-protein kinase